MKNKFLTILAGAALCITTQSCHKTETHDAAGELNDLVGKVKTKLVAGKGTEADFSGELKQFDDLLAQHKGEKTEDAARIPYMKAMLYLEVFGDVTNGAESLKQLKADFPDTKLAKTADETLAQLARQIESAKIQATLVVGAKFPDFEEKDLAGGPLSIANYKGKVVLVDFWATWCPACIMELPGVQKTYQAHHAAGFEIIGVSLDDEKSRLENFIKENNMPWPQFFDGKHWNNKLAVKYGINMAPTTYLLDGESRIIGKDLRGEELEAAVAGAVARK